MVVRAKYLYRPEYFKAQQKKDEGQILLKTSFNQNIYLFFSLSVFVAIIVFITLGEYTRRETLIGLVSPLGGMVKVQANDTGYIEKLFIKEGGKVQALTPLYEIKTERFDDSGIGIKKRVLESIDNQYIINAIVFPKYQDTSPATVWFNIGIIQCSKKVIFIYYLRQCD